MEKPFLETAPWLVVIFKKVKDDREDRITDQIYYVLVFEDPSR